MKPVTEMTRDELIGEIARLNQYIDDLHNGQEPLIPDMPAEPTPDTYPPGTPLPDGIQRFEITREMLLHPHPFPLFYPFRNQP